MPLLRQLGTLVGKGAKSVSRQGIYSFLEAQLAQLQPGERVLSIGAGGEIGTRIIAERARGVNILQLDIDDKRGADIVADLCKWRADEPFDAIICSEVLEHVWAPHLAVENMFASLREGGKLILTAPFVLPIHAAPNDFFRYTRHGLEVLLRDFKQVTIEDRNSWAESLGVLAVRMVRKRKTRALEATVVPFVAAGYPLLRAVGKLFPANEMPTGYNVIAIR
ncbi:MAG TPA: methyltransferase domain-containing protein [Kofleriaceae bacterium]|nr:methyltransferase domain-containing protein [Kofleriaceae bacterium]